MPARTPTRRVFLRVALRAAALSSLPRPLGAWAGAAPVVGDTLRIGLLVRTGAAAHPRIHSLRRGVEIGAAESTRTAMLFGVGVQLVREPFERDADAERAARRLLSAGVSAFVAGFDDTACQTVADVSAQARVVFLDAGCGATQTPDPAVCERFTFHVHPSASTLQRARNAFARRSGSDAAGGATIVLWHHSLERFGAGQLNGRFRRQFGVDMDSPAWAGWVAVKVLTDAALRGRSVESTGLARYLLRGATRFDGHKGEPLAFDPATGELRQPVYVVTRDRPAGDDRVTAELPIAAAFQPRSSRDHAPACDAAPGRPLRPAQ